MWLCWFFFFTLRNSNHLIVWLSSTTPFTRLTTYSLSYSLRSPLWPCSHFAGHGKRPKTCLDHREVFFNVCFF
jgi:hypothetical protein